MISYHSSLGVLEWPPVVFASIRYPGVSELAALQSAAFGVPADRHMEVTRTMPGPDGTRMPHSLLTEIAAYGRFPRMGSPYCRKSAKESVVSSAWTPIVDRLKRELGHPVRILKVMGLRSDEGPDRVKRAAFRTVQANSARIVDEWLPVKDWSTHAVKEWHADAPVRYRWTYDWCPAPATGPAPPRVVDRTKTRRAAAHPPSGLVGRCCDEQATLHGLLIDAAIPAGLYPIQTGLRRTRHGVSQQTAREEGADAVLDCPARRKRAICHGFLVGRSSTGLTVVVRADRAGQQAQPVREVSQRPERVGMRSLGPAVGTSTDAAQQGPPVEGLAK